MPDIRVKICGLRTEADVAAGPQVIAFDIHHPEGWPVGTYKLEISLDGTVVETREFSVK